MPTPKSDELLRLSKFSEMEWAEIDATLDAARISPEARSLIRQGLETLALQKLRKAHAAGAREEREACARVVEKQYRRDPDGVDDGCTPERTRSNVTHRCAEAIRARGSDDAE